MHIRFDFHLSEVRDKITLVLSVSGQSEALWHTRGHLQGLGRLAADRPLGINLAVVIVNQQTTLVADRDLGHRHWQHVFVSQKFSLWTHN